MIIAGDKTIKQPYVPVDGKWCTVKKEAVMVNGEWKTVFEKKAATYTINIYRYGSLYQTLTVTNGESVTLPSLGVGYATTSSSTTISYNSGATLTPTSDIDIYTVFSYSIELYKYGVLYDTLTTLTQDDSATFTLPTCTADSGETFYGWTTASGSTTKKYDSGASVSTSSMSLYAIFSYSTLSSKTVAINGTTTADVSQTYTMTDAGTITFKGWHNESHNDYYNNKTNSTDTDVTLSSTSTVRITVNDTYLTGKTGTATAITKAVNAGDVIVVTVTKGSSTSGAGASYNWSHTSTNHATLTYPISTIKYRSTK